jgi:hypothetical protein
MKPKEVTALIVLAWHFVSLVKDVERYQLNLALWRAAPTGRNLVRLALAEGIIIKDITAF